MARRSRAMRLAYLLFAALQFALPGATSLADASIDREVKSAPTSHVEAPGSADCPRVHGPDCALCRHLTTTYTRVAKAVPELPSSRATFVVSAERERRPREAWRAVELPRGPPDLLTAAA